MHLAFPPLPHSSACESTRILKICPPPRSFVQVLGGSSHCSKTSINKHQAPTKENHAVYMDQMTLSSSAGNTILAIVLMNFECFLSLVGLLI